MEHMLGHLPEIIISVAAVGGGIFIRYKFSTKREVEKEFKRMEDLCKENRSVCQTGICRKIEAVKTSGNEKTDVLTLGARDSVKILDSIRENISDVKIDIGSLRAMIEQYIKDIAKKNTEIK